ncbi:MAG: hypothetical protein ABS81_05545 [Pseudonocardia sp. SCN 72-86]|nr:MAG: hypothetical protein ABS81_05545 [Pseudonocardia sp. SCN 72-86]
MIALAAALGLVVGFVIGGLGGGGGVLTVPALVYALGQNAQAATTSSVVIVGISAAVGAVTRMKGGGVDWRTGAALGVVGIPAAYLGTALNHQVRQPVLLLAFAVLTVAAASAMLLDSRDDHGPAVEGDDTDSGGAAGASGTMTALRPATRTWLIFAAKVVACGATAGFLTGFLGVGGGFLVVPALVIVLRMPMTVAVGTSLLVIVLNSISSVVSRVGGMHLDWSVIVPFTLAAVAGTLLGKRIADRLSGVALTRSFAVLLVAVGVFVGVEAFVAI